MGIWIDFEKESWDFQNIYIYYLQNLRSRGRRGDRALAIMNSNEVKSQQGETEDQRLAVMI